jgi:hypothetical protein
MAHFAQIDKNNIVQQVIVIDNKHALTEEAGLSFIKDVLKFDGTWLQTSYNGNIRGKFAGISDIYDADKDEFVVNINHKEQLKIKNLEKINQYKAEQEKKEAIAAKIGLTVEELQTILKE